MTASEPSNLLPIQPAAFHILVALADGENTAVGPLADILIHFIIRGCCVSKAQSRG